MGADFQLIVGQAHRVQECIPARVPMEVGKERIAPHAGQPAVALTARALEPLESSIFISAICVDFGDLVGCGLGEGFRQPGERGIRFGNSFLAPPGDCHDDELGPFGRLVLRRSHGLFKLALDEEGETQTGIRRAGIPLALRQTAPSPPG